MLLQIQDETAPLDKEDICDEKSSHAELESEAPQEIVEETKESEIESTEKKMDKEKQVGPQSNEEVRSYVCIVKNRQMVKSV